MEAEMQKYLDMIAAMTVDCRMGGITIETYLANLETALGLMKKLQGKAQPTEKGAL